MPADFGVAVLLVEHMINLRQEFSDEIFFTERQNGAFIISEWQFYSGKNEAISLNVMILKRIFAVRNIGIANDKIAGIHGVFVIIDDIKPAFFSDIKQFEKILVSVNHMRVFIGIFSVDEDDIDEFNGIIHVTHLPKVF